MPPLINLGSSDSLATVSVTKLAKEVGRILEDFSTHENLISNRTALPPILEL